MISEANPVRPKDALDTMSIGDTDRIMFDGQAGVRSMLYSNFRTQLLGNATGGFVYKGTVAGNAVPNTSAAAGDYYTIISAGTSQSITWGIGDTAIYRGTSGQWNKISSALRPVNVRDFGAVLDGVTDDTAAFGLAKAACVTGGTIFAGEGTAVLHNFLIDKDINVVLSQGTILKHKANATAPMISFTATASGFFNGGVLDGNKANQATTGVGGAGVTSWFSLLKTNTASSFTVSDVTFQNFCIAGLQDNATTGRLLVQRCHFLNGAEHTNGAVTAITGYQSSGINFLVSGNNSRPHLDVFDCHFIQDNLPSQPGFAPGGCIVAGNDGNNCFVSVNCSRNYLKRVGQVAAGNNIGGIDLYEDCLDANVTGNIFEEPLYIGLKLQNLTRLICTGNIVDCTSNMIAGGTGILYDPHQRTQTTGAYEPSIIAHNIVTGITVTNGTGISIYGSVALGRKVILALNWVENCLVGMDIGGAIGMEGPISIEGNTVMGGAGAALQILRINPNGTGNGNVRIVGNHLSGGVGILSTVGVQNASFLLSANFVEATGAGSKAILIWGAAKIKSDSGTYQNSNGAGAPAVEFKQDGAAHLIGELYFPPGANIVTGINSTVIADVSRWRGLNSGSGSPEGVYAATTGDVFLRTDSGNVKYYFKNSGTGNTGWV
jgi:hypothetical protein